MQKYPKRLIEVDLPIREISYHARREKLIRKGHPSTVHLWWARRPLAACRALLCASLWPDPADDRCPASFREEASRIVTGFAKRVQTEKSVMELCATHWTRWRQVEPTTLHGSDAAACLELRQFLLDFIADFASWQASNVEVFVATASALTEAAHRALNAGRDERPLVIDPFAGGGSIPLEAIRVGAQVYASDLNPVAVTLERALLEFIPQHGRSLATAFRAEATRVRERAVARLKDFYPSDAEGGVPLLYVGARTIRCEGPDCGAEIPLLRSLWLVKKLKRGIALRIIPKRDSKSIDFEIVDGVRTSDVGSGTVRGGAATCPLCGFTTAKTGVRSQLRETRGGARDARIIAVATVRGGEVGRKYRLPDENDRRAAREAAAVLNAWAAEARASGAPSPVPDEKIPVEKVWKNNPIRVHLYGNVTWGDLFTPRQSLALAVFAEEIRKEADSIEPALRRPVATLLALALDRVMVRCTANCIWDATSECIMQIFNQGQALPARWEFAEMNPTIDDGSGWQTSIEYIADVIEQWPTVRGSATVARASATGHPLPDDSADLLFTDPPYYDAVPYAKLSDFFYVWLKRALQTVEPELFAWDVTPKLEECVVDLAVEDAEGNIKDATFFERKMTAALAESRRVVRPNGLGVVVFAHKSTAGWEAQLKAMLDAGWTITASWPIDTESENRLRAQNSAALASSVHLVCRPLEDVDGELKRRDVGDWRAVLEELPRRIKEWLPRLAAEGVVGADAIFACLGPALEVFSRYSRVEKVSGEPVPLRDYLEHVWAAVSKEALSMIFDDAETAGLEADARVTAMWLWTLAGPATDRASANDEAAPEVEDDGEDESPRPAPILGFILEFDAARKIAQGLGARLDELGHVVEVKGDKARLVAVAERTQYLFGKAEAVPTAKKVAKKKQMTLFAELEEAAAARGWGEVGAPKAATTTLDRVHQAMLLFAAGRGEALKRFIVEEGVGKQPQFWKLAQSLSALYPSGTDEKRWVDGVLARKKGLGF
jgi:adenine-specific DNA methylase